jgi:hypothetical protein
MSGKYHEIRSVRSRFDIYLVFVCTVALPVYFSALLSFFSHVKCSQLWLSLSPMFFYDFSQTHKWVVCFVSIIVM